MSAADELIRKNFRYNLLLAGYEPEAAELIIDQVMNRMAEGEANDDNA